MYQQINASVVIPKTDRLPIIEFSSNKERVLFQTGSKSNSVIFTTQQGTEYSLMFDKLVIIGEPNYIRETKDVLSTLVADIKPNTTTVYDVKLNKEKVFNYNSIIGRSMIIGSSIAYPGKASIVINEILIYDNDVLQHHYLPALDTEKDIIVFVDTESDTVLHSENNQMYIFNNNILSDKSDIQIPEGNVVKIEDQDGRVLWSKKS